MIYKGSAETVQACFKCQDGCECGDFTHKLLFGKTVILQSKCLSCLPGYIEVRERSVEGSSAAGFIVHDAVCEKITGCHAKCATCMAVDNEDMCISCSAGYTARPLLRTEINYPDVGKINFDLVVCDENEKPSLAGGAVTGIIVGTVLGVLILCGAVFFLINKIKGKKASIPAEQPKEVEMEEATA